jgi:adenylate kinase
VQKKLFLIIGAPGSGKTTDAEIIAKNNPTKISHFSTGELLRKEVKTGSELGKIINERISAGNLVPVKIAVETIIKAIESSNKDIILIDGFPRSVEQMMELEKELLSNKGITLTLVFEVKASEEVSKQRVLGRNRGNDDKEEVFINRMKVHNEPIKLIRDFYNAKDLLVQIDGERKVEDIVDEMEEIINAKV